MEREKRINFLPAESRNLKRERSKQISGVYMGIFSDGSHPVEFPGDSV